MQHDCAVLYRLFEAMCRQMDENASNVFVCCMGKLCRVRQDCRIRYESGHMLHHVEGEPKPNYFLPFFFFFFLSDADVAPPAVVGAEPPFAVAPGAVFSVPVAAAASATPVAVDGSGSGFASCKGVLEPAMANAMALLKISNLPRMAEDRVRYLIVVVSSVTLRVKLWVEGRDLIRYRVLRGFC